LRATVYHFSFPKPQIVLGRPCSFRLLYPKKKEDICSFKSQRYFLLVPCGCGSLPLCLSSGSR
jgi:hypothetical protein